MVRQLPCCRGLGVIAVACSSRRCAAKACRFFFATFYSSDSVGMGRHTCQLMTLEPPGYSFFYCCFPLLLQNDKHCDQKDWEDWRRLKGDEMQTVGVEVHKTEESEGINTYLLQTTSEKEKKKISVFYG